MARSQMNSQSMQRNSLKCRLSVSSLQPRLQGKFDNSQGSFKLAWEGQEGAESARSGGHESVVGRGDFGRG